ncbi:MULTISPECIES: EscU/YscU/HrcU family type III secretion system export apparatus switch protein [unclassified Caballeronia]|uniref:EscU/YscU/HrcU family type III secretion system export apparatus switch protein n=1 Tax=unclassified Caballeronia TaxID=2646786 RepID=UPI0028606077|nr:MULTISPECIES: EscU/YscU/HrcU family type III secretion system export apparatus switch protein [unclassified Caballeronia]MDR5774166.1 EscU/YscU/HrcU family type III secretion system export apparatus switch protein [Caballeronia sp. LZ002]MDR5849601.1 EscU/YscU/HrcU family type III secretion system export apparatus switch protein [Caballeronia sp. LZ003]
MSDHEQNKSEQATAHKLEQARKKGMVPRSPDAGIVAGLAGVVGYFWAKGDHMAQQIALIDARALHDAAFLAPGSRGMVIWAGRLMLQSASFIAPLVGVALAGAALGSLMQTGLIFAPAALKADFSRINPAQGIKRLFSVRILIEAAKACFKMAVYTAIAWTCIANTVTAALHASLTGVALAQALSTRSLKMLASLLVAALMFAVIDQVLVRRAFAKQMRMSRHEVRQEHKQREGDPRIRQRRRQLQRELLQRASSMRNMRGADVLVTNPTHYAVGLRYAPAEMAAPLLIARGTGDFALRLRRLAFIYNVPVIESRSLARRLFREAAFEKEIPGGLYREAAEIYLRIRQTSDVRGAA